MANSFAVSRNHLILGICLPLAVLLGYLLAEPMESSSLVIVVMVVSVLLVPVLMRWHHPLLIVCWNASILPYFLPGRPPIWVLMALISLFFAVLSRSVSRTNRFLSEPMITRPLIAFMVVVFATAMMTGGIGLAMLGSDTVVGGKKYFFLAAATIGYFALISRPIPRERALWYVGLFFLSGLTAVISNLAYKAGPSFWFLYELFPPELAMDQALVEGSLEPQVVRIAGFTQAAPALCCFLLARYGIRGLFEFSRPWRILLFLAGPFACLMGGYRSAFATLALICVALFFVEGLWRTRYVFIILLTGVALAAGFLPFVNQMPLSVQRTLSILPIDVDPWVKESAQSTTEWRLEMWRSLMPEVPKYLLKGKGYAISQQDAFRMAEATSRNHSTSAEALAATGDYHNGPLSVVIPFGLSGLIVFVWLLAAGIRLLHRNYRYGDPALQRINACLLAVFIAYIISFVVVFGAVSTDLHRFVGVLGLSIALNGGVRQRSEDAPAAERI